MARARHILVDSQEECDALITRIENGESFENIARQYSRCPSSAKGGDLGYFGRGQMVPSFDVVVFSAPLNSIEGPVKTQFGYHIIEVTERS